MEKFYSRLSYSLGNEDWRSENKALQIKENDKVFCITASGDRPLHLLLSPLGSIDAVDANPTQTELLHLKIAAAKALPFEEFTSFMGITSQENRLQTFEAVKENLPEHSYNFWRSHQKMIDRGVIYEGAVEKWTKKGAKLVHLLRRSKVKKLFSFKNIEEQKEFVNKEWNTTSWKKVFDLSLNPFISKISIKDPGLYEYIGDSIHPGEYINKRMQACLNRSIASESILLSLILNGEISPPAYPPLFQKEGFELIKSNLDKVNSYSKDALSFLKQADDNTYDCFSLSDIASYISEKEYGLLLEQILRTAKNGARFSIRQFLSDHRFPAHLKNNFSRDENLENTLQNEDNCFVYRYQTGKINK